jgi:hypothetical protein
MVIAPITPSRAAGLEVLLASMNIQPGQCDPVNELLPFALFERLHFARFVIVDDLTLGDLTAYGLQHPTLPVYLVFMGDCDGSAHVFLTELAERAAPGLSRIFACCDGFVPSGNLAQWLIAHDQAVSARYVNWIGRTVRQVKQEQALQRALARCLASEMPSAPQGDALALRRALCAFVEAEQRAGRLALTPHEPTPLAWRMRNLAHALGIPLLGLVALPLLIVLSPVIVYQLRCRETTDPEIDQQADGAALPAGQVFEDHDVSSPVSLTAAVKPGLFRRLAFSATLKGVDYACRHIYRRGGLMRVQSLHFAHWAFLDDKTRLLYASSHDGSFDACVQDFIDKMAWGLNLVFSHEVGYPRTDWLVRGGAYDAARFKAYARRHELPTQVWYKAYPGLTTLDLQRNTRIREGLEQGAMSEAQAREWLGLIRT